MKISTSKMHLCLLIALLFAVLLPFGCDQRASSSSNSNTSVAPHGGESDTNNKSTSMRAGRTKVTLGIQTSPAMALVMVAKNRGFFEKEGMDVEIKEFTAGKFALQAFLGGSLDFCVSGEVPVALATLQGNKLTVISTVVGKTVNEVRVVARRDGNLLDPVSYFRSKRRRLATSFGGGPEFYTYSFLNHFGIKSDEVEVISQKPEDMPAALASQTVDAIAVFDPFAYMAEQRLGDAAITFKDSSLYSEYYVLSTTPKWLQDGTGKVEAVLKGLLEAAAFIESHPSEAQDVVRRYTKLDDAVVSGIWGNFEFKPTLPKKLISVWNDQADWARKTGKIPDGQATPNFRSIINAEFLRRVSPSAVELE